MLSLCFLLTHNVQDSREKLIHRLTVYRLHPRTVQKEENEGQNKKDLIRTVRSSGYSLDTMK